MADLANLKICFLAGTLGQGGAERQLYYILQAVTKMGFQARVLSLTKGDYWERQIERLGISVQHVGQHQDRMLRLLQIFLELRRNPPDIFQSQHLYTNLYVVAAARGCAVREIGAVRSDAMLDVTLNGLVAGRLSLRIPRIIATNSKAAIQNAIRLGVPAQRLYFLPNAVDTDWFAPRWKPQREGVTLVAVGRLGPEKRFDRFLSIVSRVRQRTKTHVKAILIGAGPLRMGLKRYAEELGLGPEVVEFRGAVEDTAPVYQEADVLVLTSDSEGTPNVILEAMASGLPIVASRVGGVPEILEDTEMGYLLESDDVEGMSEALLRLIDDPSLRYQMGCNAREHVKENYSLGQLPIGLEKLYQAALA